MVKIKTLIGSLLVLLILGSVYSWSLFNTPLATKYNMDLSIIAFTFGIMTLFIAVGSSTSGFLKLRFGIQNVVALSAVCTGAGLLIASFAPNLVVLYLSAGVLLGFGDGLGYMLVLTNCVKFFPKTKGLVSALCIGAYGLGSLLFKFIDSHLLATYNVETALLTWGAICAIVVTIGSILIMDAMKQASVVSANASKREYDLHSAVRTIPYWLLSLMFFVDCMVGLYVIGVASNLGTALLNMSTLEAATAVSVVAVEYLRPPHHWHALGLSATYPPHYLRPMSVAGGYGDSYGITTEPNAVLCGDGFGFLLLWRYAHHLPIYHQRLLWH